jgi:hypothetical protein
MYISLILNIVVVGVSLRCMGEQYRELLQHSPKAPPKCSGNRRTPPLASLGPTHE